MDFDKFFENMKGDYKTFFYTIILTFPLAYIDCWKLCAGFRHYHLIPQLILALGIAVIMIFAGITADFLYCLTFRRNTFKELKIIPILFPSVMLTSVVALRLSNDIFLIISFYITIIVFTGIYALVIFLRKRRK